MKLDLGLAKGSFCDGVTRRRALRIGGTGMLSGLTIPQLLEWEAQAANDKPVRAKSCIMLYLEGGPSHIDMWDLKPDAPREIRGPYKPISTNVPGLQVGELMPHCARIADKYTIIRSHSHRDNGHATGNHWVMTGYPPNFGDGQQKGMPYNELYPSIGSMIARELGPGGPVPPYVNVPNPLGPGGPGFYGPLYSPFVVETDPVQPDFQVRDLTLSQDVSRRRFELRRMLLEEAEKLGAQAEATGRAAAMATYYEKAFSLITSPAARSAFDINSEKPEVRERYGLTSLGQCSLLARRLVASGCRFVGIEHGSWDTHVDNFTSLDSALAPHADKAFSALISDLEEHGLLYDTLVIMMGEMGRTPRINNNAGRDHWSQAQSVLVAGGGTKPGIIGATDKQAAAPTTTPIGIQDLLRTVLFLMGIDSRKIYNTPLGRPVPLVNGGHIIKELV